MAIVFVSSKGKKTIFFLGTTLVAILFLAGVFWLVFLRSPGVPPQDASLNIPLNAAYNQSNLAINLGIIDSDKVRSLEPFTVIEAVFTYTVEDKEKKQTSGNITAPTKDIAQKNLEAAGFTVVSIEEMNIG